MGLRLPGVTFEVCLHLGTLVAVLVVFRREINQIIARWSLIHKAPHRRREDLTLVLALIIGSILQGSRDTVRRQGGESV